MGTLALERGVSTLGQNLAFAGELEDVIERARSRGDKLTDPEARSGLANMLPGEDAVEVPRATLLGATRTAHGMSRMVAPDSGEFDRLFQTFEHTAFRLEALDRYAVPIEEEPVPQLESQATAPTQPIPSYPPLFSHEVTDEEEHTRPVANEIHAVGMHVTRMLMRALHDDSVTSDEVEPTEEDIAIAKVIGDVWLASLVQWVTGRASAEDVATSMEVAARLLLR